MTHWVRASLSSSVVSLGGVVLACALFVGGCKTESDPPIFMNAPRFELVDQDGRAFRSESLSGKVWVVDFFFTTCPSICPRLTAAMTAVQRDLADRGGRVHFVSITVDPQNDTPEVLRRYVAGNELRTEHWSFLTGDEKVIRDTVTNGFKTFLGPKEDHGGRYDIAHASRFFLVDAKGRVRGAYPVDTEGKKALVQDIRRLLE